MKKLEPFKAKKKEALLKDPYLQDIIERNLEVSAQSVIDIANRIISIEELEKPRDYHEAIIQLGKAGILPGKKGDIMLATAHVLEGQADNYMVNNDLGKEDFDDSVDIHVGPIITVLGTSLQNRDILDKFMTTSWKAVGLEMEGGHYQRAIDAAIIRGHIAKDVKVRYAYYASDNPLKSGQTLASGSLGTEGVRPTYMITKAILQKIFSS